MRQKARILSTKKDNAVLKRAAYGIARSDMENIGTLDSDILTDLETATRPELIRFICIR
jgi:hypothetical protein